MNRFGLVVFSIVSVILTIGYGVLMNVVMTAIDGETLTATFRIFAVVMFPATFALFLLMVFLTYHFIARALNMYVDLKWALYVIAVGWLAITAYMVSRLLL